MSREPLGRNDQQELLRRLDDETGSRRRATGVILLILSFAAVLAPLAHVHPDDGDTVDVGILGITWDTWTFSPPESGYDFDGTTGTLWMLRVASIVVLLSILACLWLVSEVVSPRSLGELRRIVRIVLGALTAGSLLVAGLVLFLGDESVDLARGWWVLPALAVWVWHVYAGTADVDRA